MSELSVCLDDHLTAAGNRRLLLRMTLREAEAEWIISGRIP